MNAADCTSRAETLSWRCQWTLAFPTLVATLLFLPEHDRMWQRLAWKQIWKDRRRENTPRRQGWKDEMSPTGTAWNRSLGYGEITEDAVWYVLDMIRNELPPNATVVDLGSGNGRVLLAAALGYCFDKAIGIEIVPELHCQAIENYQECWKRLNGGSITVYDWKCADFTIDLDWTIVADVVFCHATVFEEELIETLNELALYCRPGTFFCMVTQSLSNLETLGELRLQMNWGQANVYLQRRVLS